MARRPSSYLLARLHRLARSEKNEDENFLTECFAYLLATFIEIEPSCAKRLLACLCGPKQTRLYRAFKDNLSSISVHTQFVTSAGVVDLVLKTDDAIAFFEIKLASGFGQDQLTRYRKALSKRSERHKGLRTLTRSIPNLDSLEDTGRLTWYEVGDVVRTMKPANKVAKHLRNDFLDLLQHRKLTMKKVSWELIKGIHSLINLDNMLKGALSENGIYPTLASGKKFWRLFWPLFPRQ